MSVSLHIHVNQPMSLIDLATAAGNALHDLLNLQESIGVLASFETSPLSEGTSVNCLSDLAPLVICSVHQHEEAVRVMTFKVPFSEQLPISEWSSRADELFASVECHSARSPLCWALVAAVGIAIARRSSSAVEDHSAFFRTMPDGLQPDALLRSLAVTDMHPNVESAAIDLYARMNKSAEITVWLRKRESSG